MDTPKLEQENTRKSKCKKTCSFLNKGLTKCVWRVIIKSEKRKGNKDNE